MSSKKIQHVWIFESSSSDNSHETLQYDDGSTSCSCPGWCKRVAPDGSRSCKHTRLVDLGRADSVAVSSHSYVLKTPATTTQQTQTQTKQNYGTKKQSIETRPGFGQLGVGRKIIK